MSASGQAFFTLLTNVIVNHQKIPKTKNVAGRICLPQREWGWGRGANYVYKPNFNFLEMAHTTFSPLFEKQHISLWFELKFKKYISGSQSFRVPISSSFFIFFESTTKIYFKICSYIQKIIQNLINTFKTRIYNAKHTKHTKIYFRTYILQFDQKENPSPTTTHPLKTKGKYICIYIQK